VNEEDAPDRLERRSVERRLATMEHAIRGLEARATVQETTIQALLAWRHEVLGIRKTIRLLWPLVLALGAVVGWLIQQLIRLVGPKG